MLDTSSTMKLSKPYLAFGYCCCPFWLKLRQDLGLKVDRAGPDARHHIPRKPHMSKVNKTFDSPNHVALTDVIIRESKCDWMVVRCSGTADQSHASGEVRYAFNMGQ